MATTRTLAIKPSEIKYIKLGAGGCWEQECIEKTQTLRLGFDGQDHAQSLAGNWSAIWRDFRRRGFDKSKSTRFANEIKQFYESDENVLWVTFYDGRLWWCFSEPVITFLPDHTKTRPAIGGWKCKSLAGQTLSINHLSHDLVKKHYYQGTICPLDEIASYVLKKINGHHRLAKALIPEEVDTSVKYREGAVRTIPVNAYERSRSARTKCIKHHGRACAVCGHKMADLYGKVGETVIHVHHLRELASLGKEYEVDPIKDLRPVCPNCHAIHTSTPAMSINRLRKLLAECKPIQWPAASCCGDDG